MRALLGAVVVAAAGWLAVADPGALGDAAARLAGTLPLARVAAVGQDVIRVECGGALDEGLRRTVEWYLANRDWWQPLLSREGVGTRLGAA